MPLTYDQISAITEKKFVPKLVDNIFNRSALLKKLKAKEKPQSGGDKVMVPLNYATTTATFVYGTNASLSSGNTTVSAGTVTGSASTTVSANLTGLTSATTYYFQVVGSSSMATATGTILSFVTSSVKRVQREQRIHLSASSITFLPMSCTFSL